MLSEELAALSQLLGQPHSGEKAEFSLPLPSEEARRAHVSTAHLLIFSDLSISVISVLFLTSIELIQNY